MIHIFISLCFNYMRLCKKMVLFSFLFSWYFLSICLLGISFGEIRLESGNYWDERIAIMITLEFNLLLVASQLVAGCLPTYNLRVIGPSLKKSNTVLSLVLRNEGFSKNLPSPSLFLASFACFNLTTKFADAFHIVSIHHIKSTVSGSIVFHWARNC